MSYLKIYQAEATVKSKSHKKDYREFVSTVFKELNEPLPNIKDGRGTRSARGHADFINLPKWSRSELVILHEIAHCLQGRNGIKYSHNRFFKDIVLGLVGWFMSEKKMIELEKAYKKIYQK